MSKQDTNRNLKRFRRWLCENAVARVVNGFLPTFLDDRSKEIKVIVDDNMHPCTDGKTICVSLIPHFLDDYYSEEEWMVVLKAATAHEAQHINSSNFTDVKEIQEWYGTYLADHYELDPAIGKSIARKALNIVEDGRIERIAVQRRPGMYCPFRFLNDAIREGTAVTKMSETPAEEYRDFWGAILSYAKTGLYSPGIEVYAKTRLEEVALGVQSLIDNGVASNSSDECRNLVQELLEDVSPYIVDLIKADSKLEKSLKEQDAKPEYTSDEGESEQDNTSSGGNPLRASSSKEGEESQEEDKDGDAKKKEEQDGKKEEEQDGKKEEEQDGKKEEEQDGKDEGEQSDSAEKDDSESKPDSLKTGFTDCDKRLDPLSERDMEEIKRQIEREMSVANQAERSEKDRIDSNDLNKSDIESIRANYTGETLPVHYDTLPVAGKSELPPELKSQALSLRREIIRIQDARNKAHKGLRRGTLDTGVLWKTGLKEDTVFSRKSDPNAGSVVFYLTIDNSGSMQYSCSEGGDGVKKYQAARSAAAVIEEASKGIIPCKIALFDQASRCVNHHVIKGFDEKCNINRTWNSLSTIGPGNGNMDSVNIRISATELSRRPERKKVLILLSDGAPSAYSSKAEAFTEVRQSVLDARRKGVIVIPIMFGDAGFLYSSLKTYELMYEKNIVACEPMEIKNRLCALFHQVICR